MRGGVPADAASSSPRAPEDKPQKEASSAPKRLIVRKKKNINETKDYGSKTKATHWLQDLRGAERGPYSRRSEGASESGDEAA